MTIFLIILYINLIAFDNLLYGDIYYLLIQADC